MTEPFSIETVRERLRHHESRRQIAAKRASVALILGPQDNQLHVLFIQRAEHPDDPWSGHMALPGGRHDAADLTDLQTAIRETSEEVGIELETQAELLGELDDQRATARGRAIDMAISPFVFCVKTLNLIVPSHEVVAAHWAPISPLYDGSAETRLEVQLANGTATLPAWKIANNHVWGLTYRMVKDLFSLVTPAP